MASSTPTDFAPQIPTELIDALVLDYARPSAFLPTLVRVKDTTGKPGLKHDFDSFGDVTFAASTPGTDDTFAALTVSEDGSITAAEITGPIAVDLLSMEASGIDEAAIARQIGLAAAAKIDNDIAAVFANATAAGSSSGTTLSLASFQAAKLVLLQNSAPTGPTPDNVLPPGLTGINFVASEKAVDDLTTAIRTAGLPFGTPSDMVKLYPGAAGAMVRGEYAGVRVFGTQKVATSSSNSVNAMFVPGAVGLVTKGGYQTLRQEWVAGRSVRWNGRMVYGAGILKAAWIRKVLCASS